MDKRVCAGNHLSRLPASVSLRRCSCYSPQPSPARHACCASHGRVTACCLAEACIDNHQVWLLLIPCGFCLLDSESAMNLVAQCPQPATNHRDQFVVRIDKQQFHMQASLPLAAYQSMTVSGAATIADAACVRFSTPSLRRICCTCLPTVKGEMESCRAICLLLKP